MSFGKKKEETKQTQSQSQTRQNFDLSTPFGSTKTSGNRITYTPEFLQGQEEGLGIASQKATDILSSLNPDLTVEAAFNNPFYENTRSLLQNPIRRRQEDAARELQSQLAARNQIGSSYDALMKSYQQRDFGDQLGQADNYARNLGFDAYTQNINNQLGTLSALRGDIGQSTQQAMAPLLAALGIPAYNISGVGNSTTKGSSTQYGVDVPQLLGALL